MSAPLLVARDLWRITAPLPWRPRSVHAYLARLANGRWLLVDGGADTEAGWATLDAGVREVAGGWEAVSTLVVTHMHLDHVGLAPRSLAASGATLAMHRLDAERLAGAAQRPEEEIDFRRRILRESGAPAELWRWADAMGEPPSPPPPVEVLLEGEMGALPGASGWRWLWTPGHTAGHISLLREEDGVLIAGDAVLPTITPTLGVNRQRPDPVGDYLDALARVEGSAPAVALPGHGEPIRPPGPRLAELRAEAEAEAAAVLAALEPDGSTAAEAAARRYAGRELPVAMRLQALRETLAHLHRLERLRAVTSAAEEEGAVRFTPARG